MTPPPDTDAIACHRCEHPAAGVISIAELDEGRAAGPSVAEVALCADHLGDVAEALGFERPGVLRPRGAGLGESRGGEGGDAG